MFPRVPDPEVTLDHPDAFIRVAKKNIMLRAIKMVGKDSILALEKEIKELEGK